MTHVVIMAGGRGLRLHPLTERTPKPLLKVGQKPMLETVLERFVRQGFREFTFCVHYKADLIQDYFGDGAKWGASIAYVRETEPRGTAGALKLLPPMDGPFIVANADILAEIDYAALLRHHDSRDAIATMCLALHQYQVPYGVVNMEGAFVAGMNEKPILGWLVNAGVYVIEPRLIEGLPDGYVDMPDALAASSGFVAAYQLEGPWIDVGSFSSLEAANGMVA